MSNAVKEYAYKILFLGDAGTGKTSIIRRHVHGIFSENYKATIGVDFAVKSMHIDENSIAKLQLWDIAGQERFNSMSKVYYIGAVGAVIVFDISSYKMFADIDRWKENLLDNLFDDAKKAANFPIVVFGNKSDLLDNHIDQIVVEKEFLDRGYKGFFLTSAKHNTGIKEGLERLVTNIPRPDIPVRSLSNNSVPKLILLSPPEPESDSDDDCRC